VRSFTSYACPHDHRSPLCRLLAEAFLVTHLPIWQHRCSYTAFSTRVCACSAKELFQNSAFRKAEGSDAAGTVNGYAVAHGFSECEALPNACCSMYFVPVKAGTFPVMDQKCNNKQIATIEVQGPDQALAPDPGAAFVTPPPNLVAAHSSTWPGWMPGKFIEIDIGLSAFLSFSAQSACLLLMSLVLSLYTGRRMHQCTLVRRQACKPMS
jgi:hypothetical protein